MFILTLASRYRCVTHRYKWNYVLKYRGRPRGGPRWHRQPLTFPTTVENFSKILFFLLPCNPYCKILRPPLGIIYDSCLLINTIYGTYIFIYIFRINYKNNHINYVKDNLWDIYRISITKILFIILHITVKIAFVRHASSTYLSIKQKSWKL